MTHSQDEDQFPNVTQEDCKTSVKIFKILTWIVEAI